MSINSKSPHHIPAKYQANPYQGNGYGSNDQGIFSTQPNIVSYDNRSFSVNQKPNNQSYIKESSYQPKVYNSYAKSLTRVAETEYKNPSPKLDDGLYRKLYAIHPRFSEQLSPKNVNLKPYIANDTQKNTVPLYSNKKEASIFDEPKFKDFMVKYEANNNNTVPQDKRVHFEAQSYPLQSTQREQDTQRTIITKRAPENAKEFSYQHPSSHSFEANTQINKNNTSSYLQTSSTEASPLTVETKSWESPKQNQTQAKYHVSNEIISPTNRSNLVRAPYFPRIEDSKKMRNPIFASHDFSGFNESASATTLRPKPNLNSPHLGLISTKGYLNAQKVALAQVGTEDPVVHHSFKIDSGMGMVPITAEEKMSMTNTAIKAYLTNDSHRAFNTNETYIQSDSYRQNPESPSKIIEGVNTIDRAYAQNVSERREPDNRSSPQGSTMIQESRRDIGNSNTNFDKSLFGKMTTTGLKSVSLDSSPMLPAFKGGLTGKGTRGYGVFGPQAERRNEVPPPW